MTGGASTGTSSSSSGQPGILANFGGGLNAAASAVGRTINRGIAAVDRAVPAFASIDNAIGVNLNHLDAVNQADQQDEASYQAGAGRTLAGKIGKVAGEVGLTAPIVETGAGLAGGALAAGADAVGAGTLAGRTAQAASNLVSGAGAGSGIGLGGRVVTAATSGALKGAAAGGLTSQSGNPGSDAGYGAAWGAALGPAALAVAPLAKGLMMLTGKVGSGMLDTLAPSAGRDAGDVSTATPAAPQAAPGSSYADNPLATPSAAPAPGSGPVNALDPSATGSTTVGAPTAASDVGTSPAPPAQGIPTTIKPQGLVLTQKGAGDVADRIVRLFASGGPTSARAPLAGGAFDAAEATGNPGLGALRTYLLSNNPGASNLFAGIHDANNAARMQVLSGLMGSPADLEAMETARDAITSQARSDAFSTAQPVSAQPILDHVDQLIGSANGRPSVQGPLQLYRDQVAAVSTPDANGVPMADPADLYNTRQFLGDMISPRAKGTASDGQAAASQLMTLRPTVDSTIEQGAPGFGDYLKQFRDLSGPIDGMRWLQQQGIGITDGQGNITLTKLDSTIKTLQRQQGSNGANTAKSVTPEQYQALVDLRENLRQASAANYRGKVPGSDTARNLGSNGLVNALTAGTTGGWGHALGIALPSAGGAVEGPLGLMVGGGLAAARYGASATAQRGSNMVMNALVQRMTDPEAFGKTFNALAPGR